jgi:chromosome partitioning protein
LIDPPPSLGVFTVNAMIASNSVIVPLQAHSFALDALTQLEATIKLVSRLNSSLSLGGLVITMHDKRTALSKEVEATARERYGELVFKTVIPLTTRLAEAPAAGEPVSLYAPGSTGAVAYKALAEEVKERYD